MTIRKPLIVNSDGIWSELPSGDSISGLNTSGTTIIDFGPSGTNETSVAVTGQTSIQTSSIASAWIAAEATVDRTVNDHSYAALFIALTCDTPVAGVGFTILGRSTEQMTGSYTVRWSWS
jgi:hypothetical protein